MSAQIIGLIAGIVACLSFLPYYVSIYRKKTKPHRATWIIWLICSCVQATSYYGVGARSTIWVPIVHVVAISLVVLMSIWHGVGGWTQFDRLCFAFALGSALPMLCHSMGTSLVLVLIIDFCGLLPTILKTYHYPKQEDFSAWLLSFISNLLNLFAIELWDLNNALLPLYMLAVSSVMLLLISRKIN